MLWFPISHPHLAPFRPHCPPNTTCYLYEQRVIRSLHEHDTDTTKLRTLRIVAESSNLSLCCAFELSTRIKAWAWVDTPVHMMKHIARLQPHTVPYVCCRSSPDEGQTIPCPCPSCCALRDQRLFSFSLQLAGRTALLLRKLPTHEDVHESDISSIILLYWAAGAVQAPS
jgi:hypothetical protein